MQNKKGQEEIIGFVLIVLLVSVIAVVFLAINIRKPSEKLPSAEIESFLQSSMRYSTSCLISSERRYSLKDVIVSCAGNNEKCLNNMTACDTLNYTADKLLREGFKPCPDCPTNAYRLKIYGTSNRTIINLREGNCSGTITTSLLSLPTYSDKVKIELEVCREI
ncbi:MAG: hypothetical protein KKB21_05720 [Nanoarchaeota archaeon]|nr:hypothetical protein [Nanoarchaeota archaeon]